MQRSETFLSALSQMRKTLPSLRCDLSKRFEVSLHENKAFCTAFETCFEALFCLFKQEYARRREFHVFDALTNLEPDFSREHLTTLLMQYFLLRPVLQWLFPDVLNQNRITRHIEPCRQAFGNQAFLARAMDDSLCIIEQEVHACVSSDDKQHVTNCIYEHFINGFDAKQADVRGVICTPLEVVNYMCASVEEQLKQAYGRGLSSAQVPILDPCAGTGVFLVNIIGRIDQGALPYKYEHELFCIEIGFLPYYIATLNIEQRFFERTGGYLPFKGIHYVDALLLA